MTEEQKRNSFMTKIKRTADGCWLLNQTASQNSDSLNALISQLRDALLANQVFHTPIALRRRGGQWDEYEIDAINRTREALAASNRKTTEL